MEKIILGQYDFFWAEVLADPKKRRWKGQEEKKTCGQLEAHF